MDSAPQGGLLGFEPSTPVPDSLRRNSGAPGNLAVAQDGESGIAQDGAHFCLNIGLASLKAPRVRRALSLRTPQLLQLLLVLSDLRYAGDKAALEVCNALLQTPGLVFTAGPRDH